MTAPGKCGAVFDSGGGRRYVCALPAGHPSQHDSDPGQRTGVAWSYEDPAAPVDIASARAYARQVLDDEGADNDISGPAALARAVLALSDRVAKLEAVATWCLWQASAAQGRAEACDTNAAWLGERDRPTASEHNEGQADAYRACAAKILGAK